MGGEVQVSAMPVTLPASVVVAPAQSLDQAKMPLAAGQVENAGAKPAGTLTAVAISGVKGNLGSRGSRVEVGGGATSSARDESADVEKVQAQALRGLAAALRKKGDAVTVVLRPEALGKIRIDLKFAQAGVQGMLRCSTESARELLSNQVDGLTRAMESRGIVVDRLEVVHDPKIDPSPGMWDAAGARQHDQSGQDGGAGGTSDQHSGGAEGSQGKSGESDQEVDVIIHDTAFAWDGSRMALSTLA
jgi:flagellar hook-length control protein FliK